MYSVRRQMAEKSRLSSCTSPEELDDALGEVAGDRFRQRNIGKLSEKASKLAYSCY